MKHEAYKQTIWNMYTQWQKMKEKKSTIHNIVKTIDSKQQQNKMSTVKFKANEKLCNPN